MRLFRQLGTWGTAVALTPLLWVLSCALARALAQQAYDTHIMAITRSFRVADGPMVHGRSLPATGKPIRDPRVLTEVEKYLQVWSLEPGASAVFPDASRFPWCWNPFRTSAITMRLKQKQAFLLTQHHEVQKFDMGSGRALYFLAPDGQAALGGRRFLAEAEGARLVKVVEP